MASLSACASRQASRDHSTPGLPRNPNRARRARKPSGACSPRRSGSRPTSNRQRCPRHQTRSYELWGIDRRTPRGPVCGCGRPRNDRRAMPRGSRAPELDAPRARDGDERSPLVHCGLRGWQGDAGLPRRLRSRCGVTPKVRSSPINRMEIRLPRVIVIVRESGRLKPDYSLEFDLPDIPAVGSYLSIQRPDKPRPLRGGLDCPRGLVAP